MTSIITPHLILKKSTKVLLLKRHANLQVFSGYWHLPAGRMENNEDPKSALVREVREELGIDVTLCLESVIPTKVPDYRNPAEVYRDVCMFFSANCYSKEISNIEPHFHTEFGWFDLYSLPQPIVPVVEFGLRCFALKISYCKLNIILE